MSGSIIRRETVDIHSVVELKKLASVIGAQLSKLLVESDQRGQRGGVDELINIERPGGGAEERAGSDHAVAAVVREDTTH